MPHQPLDPLENMGRIAKVGFPSNKPSFSGVKIFKNKPTTKPCNWYTGINVYTEVEGFSYNPAKNVTWATGIVISEKWRDWDPPGPRTQIYFPTLLKSGARCLLDIPTQYVVYLIEDPERIQKRFLMEFAKLFCEDNFKMIELLTRWKNV